ncbi:MAG: hypothetical protein Q8N81_02190, partial [bacterium]|nr:hypothetical protein [bacterium]
ASLMEKASIPAAFLLGILVGFFEFPCTGGPYIVILGMLHDQAILLKFKGLLYLVYYNFLFVLPLIIMLAIASEESLMRRLNSWKKENSGKMRLYGGLAAIVLGLLILSL